MQFSFLHLLVVVVLVVLLFGRGKISDLMGDVATGIKNFKKGLSEDEHVTLKVDTKDVSAKADKVTAAKAKPAKAKSVKAKS